MRGRSPLTLLHHSDHILSRSFLAVSELTGLSVLSFRIAMFSGWTKVTTELHCILLIEQIVSCNFYNGLEFDLLSVFWEIS